MNRFCCNSALISLVSSSVFRCILLRFRSLFWYDGAVSTADLLVYTASAAVYEAGSASIVVFLLYAADYAAILHHFLQYEANSAANLPPVLDRAAILLHYILKYSVDSAAILPFLLLYEADFARFLLFIRLYSAAIAVVILVWSRFCCRASLAVYEAGSASILLVFLL